MHVVLFFSWAKDLIGCFFLLELIFLSSVGSASAGPECILDAVRSPICFPAGIVNVSYSVWQQFDTCMMTEACLSVLYPSVRFPSAGLTNTVWRDNKRMKPNVRACEDSVSVYVVIKISF